MKIGEISDNEALAPTRAHDAESNASNVFVSTLGDSLASPRADNENTQFDENTPFLSRGASTSASSLSYGASANTSSLSNGASASTSSASAKNFTYQKPSRADSTKYYFFKTFVLISFLAEALYFVFTAYDGKKGLDLSLSEGAGIELGTDTLYAAAIFLALLDFVINLLLVHPNKASREFAGLEVVKAKEVEGANDENKEILAKEKAKSSLPAPANSPSKNVLTWSQWTKKMGQKYVFNTRVLSHYIPMGFVQYNFFIGPFTDGIAIWVLLKNASKIGINLSPTLEKVIFLGGTAIFAAAGDIYYNAQAYKKVLKFFDRYISGFRTSPFTHLYKYNKSMAANSAIRQLTTHAFRTFVFYLILNQFLTEDFTAATGVGISSSLTSILSMLSGLAGGISSVATRSHPANALYLKFDKVKELKKGKYVTTDEYKLINGKVAIGEQDPDALRNAYSLTLSWKDSIKYIAHNVPLAAVRSVSLSYLLSKAVILLLSHKIPLGPEVASILISSLLLGVPTFYHALSSDYKNDVNGHIGKELRKQAESIAKLIEVDILEKTKKTVSDEICNRPYLADKIRADEAFLKKFQQQLLKKINAMRSDHDGAGSVQVAGYQSSDDQSNGTVKSAERRELINGAISAFLADISTEVGYTGKYTTTAKNRVRDEAIWWLATFANIASQTIRGSVAVLAVSQVLSPYLGLPTSVVVGLFLGGEVGITNGLFFQPDALEGMKSVFNSASSLFCCGVTVLGGDVDSSKKAAITQSSKQATKTAAAIKNALALDDSEEDAESDDLYGGLTL